MSSTSHPKRRRAKGSTARPPASVLRFFDLEAVDEDDVGTPGARGGVTTPYQDDDGASDEMKDFIVNGEVEDGERDASNFESCSNPTAMQSAESDTIAVVPPNAEELMISQRVQADHDLFDGMRQHLQQFAKPPSSPAISLSAGPANAAQITPATKRRRKERDPKDFIVDDGVEDGERDTSTSESCSNLTAMHSAESETIAVVPPMISQPVQAVHDLSEGARQHQQLTEPPSSPAIRLNASPANAAQIITPVSNKRQRKRRDPATAVRVGSVLEIPTTDLCKRTIRRNAVYEYPVNATPAQIASCGLGHAYPDTYMNWLTACYGPDWRNTTSGIMFHVTSKDIIKRKLIAKSMPIHPSLPRVVVCLISQTAQKYHHHSEGSPPKQKGNGRGPDARQQLGRGPDTTPRKPRQLERGPRKPRQQLGRGTTPRKPRQSRPKRGRGTDATSRKPTATTRTSNRRPAVKGARTDEVVFRSEYERHESDTVRGDDRVRGQEDAALRREAWPFKLDGSRVVTAEDEERCLRSYLNATGSRALATNPCAVCSEMVKLSDLYTKVLDDTCQCLSNQNRCPVPAHDGKLDCDCDKGRGNCAECNVTQWLGVLGLADATRRDHYRSVRSNIMLSTSLNFTSCMYRHPY
jgi:hypothetical protein